MLSILWNFLQFVAFFVHLRFCFSPPESTLRENWNVLRLLNRKKKSARIPTETYKSTMHDTAGSVSHTGHRLFTRTTPRIRGSDHTDHRLFSLHSNPFFSLLYFLKLSILSPALPLFFPLGIYIFFFFSTHFSVILPMSSIIIFSPSYILTQKLTSLPPSFPSQFLIFLYNTVCQPFALTIKISPVPVIICLWQLGRALCVWRYADLLFVKAVFAQTDTG